MTFYFKAPKSSKYGRPMGPSCGDLDKLSRAVLDALTIAGAIKDDRFVCRLVAEKRFAPVNATHLHVDWMIRP